VEGKVVGAPGKKLWSTWRTKKTGSLHQNLLLPTGMGVPEEEVTGIKLEDSSAEINLTPLED